MKISAKTKICLIIGDPVAHSLSPAMHNAGYEALGIDDQFIFLGAKVKVEDIETAVESMRKMGIHGLTCTIPHKVEVMKYLDEINETAKKIGAVNTVLNQNGKLVGFNTDWLGVILPLEKMTTLSDKKVLVLGAGGAARAVVYGLLKKGAKVKIFNRTKEKAIELAKEFNCQATDLKIESEIKDFDIIINTTAVGMKPLDQETPISTKFISDKQIVFDIVYIPFETKLLKEAKKRGATIIHGIEMLLYQGTAQFEIYTGRKAPEEVMRKILYEKIKICTPVIGKTLREFLKNLDQVQEVSDMVELKVDKIENLNKKNLQIIRKKTKKEAIFTSRKEEIILKALNLGFDYLDIELSLISNLDLSKKGKTKIILSFHDFKKTPTLQELTTIVNRMREYNVEIIKIATIINNNQDINNLFKILLNKKKDEKIIVVGMGEKGQIIRIFGPFLGSFLTFASTIYGETAPGQIDIKKMQNIYKLLT